MCGWWLLGGDGARGLALVLRIVSAGDSQSWMDVVAHVLDSLRILVTAKHGADKDPHRVLAARDFGDRSIRKKVEVHIHQRATKLDALTHRSQLWHSALEDLQGERTVRLL